MSDDPLILTLRFDDASFAHFDAMRRRHFPSKRNHIPAHLTLFHHLPGDEAAAIRQTIEDVAADHAPFELEVHDLRFLGYGSAYDVRSRTLDALRSDLATRWSDRLTRQDSQPFYGHVTIQNKVPATQAKSLFAELESEFRPFTVQATGLLLWRYRGGPWDLSATIPFDGRQSPSAPEEGSM